MEETIDIAVRPEQLDDQEFLRSELRHRLGLGASDPIHFRVIKRSLDARRKIVYRLRIQVSTDGPLEVDPIEPNIQPLESSSESVHIIGAGPAGLFAALQCLEMGLRPVVYERGKDVRARRRDIAKLNKEHIVDPESNYCFGEGGAGAYSDGKLYTRSKKRGDVQKILETLVLHGAARDILIDAHPHIGTNKLPGIITAIRETILDHGGEIHFNARLTDIIIRDQQVQAILINGDQEIAVDQLILATGHSARDIFTLCRERDIRIENKDFALGVRVEHPQELVDRMQYGKSTRPDILPPASYNLVCQVGDTGVFSFCMCPGGIIAPCATRPGEIVTNGWSPSKRNNPYANSGIVVQVRDADIRPFAEHGALAGMHFQASVEKRAWKLAGETQTAPAQRLNDFVHGRVSSDLPDCSYYPGITSVDLGLVLPERIHRALQSAFKQFGKKMPAYLTNEAVVVATESRTSSPIRIPRDKETLQHVDIQGLYPCGEGAGYAGGIVSAAIDGQRCVQAIVKQIGN